MDIDLDNKAFDATTEESIPADNWSKANSDSSTSPHSHSFDDAIFPEGTIPRRRNTVLENNSQQDGMLRSKEWKWKDDDNEDDDDDVDDDDDDDYNYENEEHNDVKMDEDTEESGYGKGEENEEDTDDQCSDYLFGERNDTRYSSDGIDLNEGHSTSSQDLSPDKEYISRDEEAHVEHTPLLKPHHFPKNLLKDERVPSLKSIDEQGQDHLSPIVEGEVMDFSRDQTPVGSNYNIAHHLTYADESFLYNSQLSLGSITDKGKGRACTMQNLHEHDSFLNLTSETKVSKVMHRALIYLKDDISFGSFAALNTIAIRETEKALALDGEKPIHVVPSRNHTRNVIAMSASIALVFIALGSVRNLQSSINHEGGVGVLSMAVSFIGYMLGSMGSPTIVQIIQPKKCVIVGLIPHLVYVASNIYPTMWLLGLTSLFQGISLAVVWNAMSTYMTLLANGQSQMTGQDYSQVSSHYFGIFGLFFQSYFIVGNLIASLVLTNGDSSPYDKERHPIIVNGSSIAAQTSNSSANHTFLKETNPSVVSTEPSDYLHLCGAKFWQHYDLGSGAYYVSLDTKYLLFGIYMGCVFVSILIALFILEPLNPKLFQRSAKRTHQLKKQLHSLLRLWMSPTFLIIAPMLVYSFIEVGFITAEVTKAFVTCPIGIHMVGYTMMCMGICGSISSYVSGIAIKCIGRKTQIIFAALGNLAVLVFLLYWHPTTDSYVPYFVILGMWGISDGIWVAQINSFLCVTFPESYEDAFAGIRMCQGIGAAIVFGSSQSLSMMSKIYFTGIWCTISVVLYVIHDCYSPSKHKLAVMEKLVMRQTSV